MTTAQRRWWVWTAAVAERLEMKAVVGAAYSRWPAQEEQQQVGRLARAPNSLRAQSLVLEQEQQHKQNRIGEMMCEEQLCGQKQVVKTCGGYSATPVSGFFLSETVYAMASDMSKPMDRSEDPATSRTDAAR